MSRTGAATLVLAIALGAAGLGASALGAVAGPVRPARALYYERSSGGTLAIARIPLAGRRPSTDVVPLGDVNIFAIALDGPDVMFTTQGGAADRGAIWRATPGEGVTRLMVAGLPAPASLVATRRYLYWTDQRAIGRVNLDGRRQQRRFLVLPQEPGGGVADGLATDGTHLYFTRCTEHAIGRADLDGSHVGLAVIATAPGAVPRAWRLPGGISTGPISARERSGAPS